MQKIFFANFSCNLVAENIPLKCSSLWFHPSVNYPIGWPLDFLDYCLYFFVCVSFPPISRRLFHHPILISYWFPHVYIQCFYWICDSSYILICKSYLLLNNFLQWYVLILVTIRTIRVINYVFLHEDIFLFSLGSFLCLLCFSSFFHIISFLKLFLILDVCSYLRVRKKLIKLSVYSQVCWYLGLLSLVTLLP